MIKTISFAPPRAPRPPKSAGKTSGKSANARVASSAVPAKSPPAKTQTANVQSPKTPTAKASASAPATLDVSKVRAALQQNAAPAKKPRAAKSAPVAKAAAQSAVASEESKTSATKVVENKATPVAKRSRVPKDLAAQYGGAPAIEDVPRHVVEASAPRKRLTRAKKEARSQLLRADDSVLQRLQQANAVEAKKPASRGRGWEFECGCCGRVSRFGTPAALCQCGAIAVKE